jgi:hypothetical protein
MKLDSTIFEEFQKITGKDISKYFSDALAFFSQDYNDIVNYYSGNVDKITSVSFNNFDALERSNKDIMETFAQHSRQFNNIKWWYLIEQIEDIDTRLKTLRHINKWSRSSLTKVGYDPSIQVDFVLKQNQTIENVARDLLQSANPNDDWTDIAIKNNLEEEDYSKEGGNNLQVKMQRVNIGTKINSVVDVIIGKSIYGKDLNKKLQFDSVTNDLKVLGHDDTIVQAVNILSNLKKNDNPDNPNAGLQSTLVAGTNRAMFNFPAIIRQLNETFAGDDTLKNFKVNSLLLEQDNMIMEFSVQSRLDETFDMSTAL